VAGDDEDDVLDALERACTARLVEEDSSAIGRYSFVHALTRDALYDSLGVTRRARLHRRVAEAIESRYADDLKDHFGALAFHYSAAGTDLPKAVEYSGRAGEQALARLAHEDAAKQFERGLALLAEQDRAAATCSCRRASSRKEFRWVVCWPTSTNWSGSALTREPQTARTFWASSPFRPGAMSNSTRWPSSRVRYPSPWIAEKWTKTSSLPSMAMKP
jgi:hypothetical protein